MYNPNLGLENRETISVFKSSTIPWVSMLKAALRHPHCGGRFSTQMVMLRSDGVALFGAIGLWDESLGSKASISSEVRFMARSNKQGLADRNKLQTSTNKKMVCSCRKASTSTAIGWQRRLTYTPVLGSAIPLYGLKRYQVVANADCGGES